MNLQKYNQRLLAILGTVGVLVLVVALFSVIAVSIMQFNRYSYYEETGILSDEKIEALQKENKREQVISYDAPFLVDSVESIYIIPVSHKTLNEQEDIKGLTNLYSASGDYEPSDDRFSSYHYGSFNNIVVYHSKNEEEHKLFDMRVNFNQIETKRFNDDILLIVRAASTDSYKDGVVNLKDMKSMYVYSISNKELKEIGIDGLEVFDYNFIQDSKDIIIEFGVDKNKDGHFESYNEPVIIKRYYYDTGKLEDVVSMEVQGDLQKTLEGSPK